MLFYLVTILAIILGLVCTRNEDKSDRIITCLLGALAIGLLFVCLGFAAPTETTTTISTTQLISFQDTLNLDKNIYLLTGSSGNEVSYSVLIKNDNGIITKTLDGSDIYIQIDDKNPRIEEEYQLMNDADWWNKYITPFKNDYIPLKTKTTIFVPSDSIAPLLFTTLNK